MYYYETRVPKKEANSSHYISFEYTTETLSFSKVSSLLVAVAFS